MQMLEFHLAGIYKLFISILRNMVGPSTPLTGLNFPVVCFATARSKAVLPYVPIICIYVYIFLSYLYA